MQALIELGWVNKWFEGDTPTEIMQKVEEYQDFDCLLYMGASNESGDGLKELQKLREFVEKYRENELTVEDLKALNCHLAPGNFICHEIEE